MRIETFDNATLYLGDCREVLPSLSGVDAVVTDPPYGINENDRKAASRKQLAVPRDYGQFTWDKQAAAPDIIDQLRRISSWQIIFGGNFFRLPPRPCWLVWDKQNSGDFADCELAWTNLPGAVRLIQWRWNGMIRRGDDVREHPTQKPVGVMMWCLEKLPTRRNIVLDPFMGSGTTGVACARLDQKFIGIEIESRYFDIACRRIEEAYRQGDLLNSLPIADDPADARMADLWVEPECDT